MYFDPSFGGGGWPGFNGGFMGLGNFGGGWMPPQMSWGAQYMPGGQQGMAGQMPEPQTASYQPQIDKLKGRIGSLQNRATAADPAQAAQLQQRIGSLQGRVKDMRKQRRQDAAPQNDMAQAPQGGDISGATPYGGPMPMGFGMGGAGIYGAGGMGAGMFPWGGYNPTAQQGGAAPYGGQMPTGANRPGMQYRQDRRQANRQGEAAPGPNPSAQPVAPQQGGAPSWYEMGNYQTPFGNLVQSNSGDGRLAKMNNGDGQQQYGFNGQSWQLATPENMGSFIDPMQNAAAAGASRAQYQQQGGMWKPMAGFGTYA